MSASNLPIFREALAWRQAGRAVAMACVVETWGSAPRPPGSRLVVDADGNFSGSVSGGCVEAEVITAALETMQADAPRLLEFGVADEMAWRAGLSCGGRGYPMPSGALCYELPIAMPAMNTKTPPTTT